MADYKTVSTSNSDFFIEKKSRFIGYVCPVSTEQQAIDFINQIKKKHSDARHNVYAYVLRENNKQRYSDDGEPQGTGGLPVLDVIIKQGLTDVCVVVTRYFGGVLLGTGGLTRAYSNGCKIAIESGKPVVMSECAEFTINCDYNQYNILQNLFVKKSVVVNNSDFAENVKLDCYIKTNELNGLKNELSEKFAGSLILKENGINYHSFEIK